MIRLSNLVTRPYSSRRADTAGSRTGDLRDVPGGVLSVGLNIDPSATGTASALRLARLADESGLNFAGIQDHLYHPEFLDAWTLISTLTASTQHLTFMPNVANTVLRPPAPLITPPPH
ncbi:LLM class flavin-dependent oxidoreductase [Streptomyces sp. NPDC000880]